MIKKMKLFKNLLVFIAFFSIINFNFSYAIEVTYRFPKVFDDTISTELVYDNTIDNSQYYKQTDTFKRLKQDTIASGRQVDYAEKFLDNLPIKYISDNNYASKKCGISNIRTLGALPVLLSSIIEYKNKKAVQPMEVLEYARTRNLEENFGISLENGIKILKENGIKIESININSEEELKNIIKSNGKILMHLKAGYFQNFDIVICVCGYQEKNNTTYFNILDTTNNVNTNRAHKFIKFKDDILESYIIR